MSTKQKILDTALSLFNQKGATDITTNHLASALSMSPGNLYYHFSNKEEIIRALFNAYDDASKILFALPQDEVLSIFNLERLIEGNFELQWEYRFLFRYLMTLLRRDSELNASYLIHRNHGVENSRQLITLYARSGVIAPVRDEFELDILTRLIWMVSDFWLPSLELGGETITPERFRQGVALIRQISGSRTPPIPPSKLEH